MKKDTLLPPKKVKVPKIAGNHPANVKSSAKVGRPTLYKPEYNEQARKFCLMGATDAELADFFEVSLDTIKEWKNVHEEFSASVKKGKSQADANVADRLFQRAMGYEHPEVDIRVVNQEIIKTPITKIYAPDTTAAIFWLKNRQRAAWRDRVETELTGVNGGPVEVSAMLSLDGVSTEALAEIMAAKDAVKRG